LQEREGAVPAVDLGEVIDHYNKAVADLPDHNKLKGLKLPGASVVLDRKGERFAEVFEENQRRQWVPLSDIPEHVQKAFLAAEDKRFYRHRGIDERGLIRAFIGNLAQSGRPQGGSTITQQIVKNLLVGEDLTYDRKIREMIVASRVEHYAEQSRDPRALSQFGLSRPRLLGDRTRGPQLFRQAGEEPDPGRGRPSCLP
jgi:membrane carboxypeptidase/penicillin-binding protein